MARTTDCPAACCTFALAALLACGLAEPVEAHETFSRQAEARDSVPAPAEARDAVPALPAVRITGEAPRIDGRLDDPAWAEAPVADGFVQVEPHEGDPASEPTEVRVLYDDEALYVAFRAWDSRPDSIVGQLTRRDQHSPSDWLHLVVDSYHDRRTAFHFAVNPVGVKMDLYRYNDTAEDPGWDAVWDVATAVDDEGWTAEFRIPLSQLRFSNAPVQTWGINFGRDLARRNELSVWSPFTMQDQRIVSRSGELRGLTDLSAGRRIELLPYTVARAARAPGDPANPFFSSTEVRGEVGADLKIGVSSNLTLDLTVNPDFGQVEADPAQVNLTQFETFLPERRPFFLEGAGIFRFGIGLGDGDGANESLFYSRRIGRAPQGRASGGGGWVDQPQQTRILGAGKLSGKTEDGWSVGALTAVTGEERARVATPDGSRESFAVEPLSNYSMLRIQRDFREGSSAVGVVGTTVFRDEGTADPLGLRSRAVAGGMDFRHRFRQNTMEVRGYLLGSHVGGSTDAILATQRAPSRSFHRPDADHLEVDEHKTSLHGWSGALELMKVGGGPWRYGSLTQVRSPGFEVNDLGFMPEADFLMHAVFAGYRNNRAGAHLRNWGVNTSWFSRWTFGRENTALGGNVNANVTFNNHWFAHAGVNVNGSALNPTLLRGGPAFRTEHSFGGWAGMGTDPRRDVQLSWNANWGWRPGSESWNYSLSPNVRWRPSERATVRVGPSFSRRIEDRQWVARVDPGGGPHYLFGRMEQSTAALTARMDLAVTPTLSLQLYAQPFLSAGSFDEFKQVTDPRARSYDDRFRPVPVEALNGTIRADLNGNGSLVEIPNPEFNVSQFRSNAVLRWEYRPGSTLYLVWAQARDHFERDGRFQISDGVDTLFGRPAENVLMVKASYWLNP